MAKKKTKKKNDKPEQVKVTEQQVLDLTKQLMDSNLSGEVQSFFAGLLKSNRWLIQKLEEGKLSIKRLQKLFGVNAEPNKKYAERKLRANKDTSDGAPQK